MEILIDHGTSVDIHYGDKKPMFPAWLESTMADTPKLKSRPCLPPPFSEAPTASPLVTGIPPILTGKAPPPPMLPTRATPTRKRTFP